MEFPDLGRYCGESSCSRLDFLPISCDACHRVFCSDHWEYKNHGCQESYVKNVQVPVCPLCGQVVPIKRGEDPNREVDQHIQLNCSIKSSSKIQTYKCSYKGCKAKEMIRVTCASCKNVYCIRHRLESSHACGGRARNQGKLLTGGVSSMEEVKSARLKAVQRKSNPVPAQQKCAGAVTTTPNAAVNQEQCDDDEALARAIAASLEDQAAMPKKKEAEAKKDVDTSDNCVLS